MNPLAWRRVGRLILFTGAFLFSVGSAEPVAAEVGPEGEWVFAGPPAVGVSLGTLITLQNGTALLIGPAVQRFDPNTSAWIPAGALMGRGGVPTLLASGKVLITGLSPAEVYDPAAGASTLTGAMIIPRTGHQATLLVSGDVLVSGGTDANRRLVGPAEIYHPGGGTWTLTGTMNNPRSGHTAILLPTGKALAAGGATTAELYDPTTGTWAFTSPNSVGGAASALLADGRVLVVGGLPVSFPSPPYSQLFDYSTETWSPPVVVAGTNPGGLIGLGPQTLARLNDGQVLLVWTYSGLTCAHPAAALFDPTANVWVLTSAPIDAGEGDSPSLIVLRDGRALHASPPCGGGNTVAAAQLFRPDNTTPRLALTPATLDFGNVAIGVPVQQAVTVQNTGQANLSGSAALSNIPGFSLVSGTTYTLAAGAASSVVVRFSSSTLGAFSGTATFGSNGGWVSVPLSATVGIMLSGRVFQTGGTGVPSVPIELHGTSSGSTTTDANGAYAFFVQPGTYTVVPASPTLMFSPPSRNIVVSNTSVTGLDFEVPAALQAAALPSSRSVQVGRLATAFATIINATSAVATACGISPLTGVPATFMYQTTAPSTNVVMGTPNTPVPIPGGGSQTFVFAFSPTGPFPPTNIQLSFDCTNTTPAPVVSGVNTLLLSASTTPVPDIVALAATLNNDGIVNIPGANGTGVFAVATVNVGAGASITASADTGSASLPVSIALCQTNPTTGVCLGPLAGSVTTQINAGRHRPSASS